MSVVNLSSQTGTGLSIAAEATVATYAAAIDGWVSGRLLLSNLNGAAAVITLKVQLLDASNVKLGVPVSFSVAKDAAADAVFAVTWGPVRVLSGQKLRVRAISSNSSDTNASWESLMDDADVASANSTMLLTIGGDASIAAAQSGSANANTSTLISDIENVVIPQTNLIGTDSADSPNAIAAQGVIAAIFVFTGANAVTITVTDATPIALSSALVRITQGSNTQLVQTDGSGIATFSLDDGDYTLSITKGGYSFTPTTIAIDGTHVSFTKVMTDASLPVPTDPSDCTVGFIARHNGAAMSGHAFTFRCKTAPTGNGNGFVDETRTAIADGTGLVAIALPQTSAWTVRGAFGGLFEITVPAADTYLVPNFNV